jgi:hypothetical protein
VQLLRCPAPPRTDIQIVEKQTSLPCLDPYRIPGCHARQARPIVLDPIALLYVTSVRKLAERCRISCMGLAKVCRKLSVSPPGSGLRGEPEYWKIHAEAAAVACAWKQWVKP